MLDVGVAYCYQLWNVILFVILYPLRERTATQLILTELHQTTQAHLPTTAPNRSLHPQFNKYSLRHSLPSRLLRVSLRTSFIFPSSLTFHERPRKPLVNATHRVKLNGSSSSSTGQISVVGSATGSATKIEDHPPVTPTHTHTSPASQTHTTHEHHRTKLPPLEMGKHPLTALSPKMTNNCPTNTTVTSVVLPPTTTTATTTTSTTTKDACSGTSVEKLPQLTPSHETNQPLKRSSLSGTTGRTVSKNRHEPKPRSKQNVKKLQRSSKKVWVCGWVSVWVGELSGWVSEWVSRWYNL